MRSRLRRWEDIPPAGREKRRFNALFAGPKKDIGFVGISVGFLKDFYIPLWHNAAILKKKQEVLS